MHKLAWTALFLPSLLAPPVDTLTIPPWNGFTGAASFTFDEGSLVLHPK